MQSYGTLSWQPFLFGVPYDVDVEMIHGLGTVRTVVYLWKRIQLSKVQFFKKANVKKIKNENDINGHYTNK